MRKKIVILTAEIQQLEDGRWVARIPDNPSFYNTGNSSGDAVVNLINSYPYYFGVNIQLTEKKRGHKRE